MAAPNTLPDTRNRPLFVRGIEMCDQLIALRDEQLGWSWEASIEDVKAYLTRGLATLEHQLTNLPTTAPAPLGPCDGQSLVGRGYGDR